MSFQPTEKEKSLAELMARVLKEPLKPLDKSMADLNGELSDIKQLADDSAGTLSLCLENAEGAFKQSKEAVKLSRSLHDEHLPALKSSIAQHAQDGVEAVQAQLSAYTDRSASALEAVAKDVLSALDGVNQEQRSTAQTIEALPAHIRQELGITNASLEDLDQTLQDQIRQSQALVDTAIAQAQAQLEATSSAIALGLKSTTGRISQLVMHQQRTAQAAHQAMFSEMRDAAAQAQAATAESVQTAQALNESLSARHDELIAAFANHTEALNARLDRSQAKVRNLTITTGVLLVLMAVYVAYGLLGHLS